LTSLPAYARLKNNTTGSNKALPKPLALASFTMCEHKTCLGRHFPFSFLVHIIQEMKNIVNIVLFELRIFVKSNFFDDILSNSPFEEGFFKQISNDT
jgi:hypothetical protein